MMNNFLSNNGFIKTVNLLALYVEPAFENEICENIYNRFNNDPKLMAIPVLRGKTPIGLLKRMEFLIRLADRYGRPLYGKQPVTVIMDKNPMIVKSHMRIETLNKNILTNNQDALQEGFIVVKDGVYVGVGSAHTLLQANMLNAEIQMENLKQARLAAEEASQAKSTFLANMSHELRTPLNAVIGFSELIISQSSEVLSGTRTLDYINDINISGNHLLGMINNILDMSRIESGKYELNQSEEEPDELVDQAIRFLKTKALSKNIKIIKQSHNVLDDVLVDAQLMKQVLINLICNAVKFSQNNTNILIDITQDKYGAISFSVIDEGCGIPEDMIEEVLKPFTQLEGAFVKNHEGTGLGLPLVQAFIKAHDGELRITNGKERGINATVSLPLDRTVFIEKAHKAYSI